MRPTTLVAVTTCLMMAFTLSASASPGSPRAGAAPKDEPPPGAEAWDSDTNAELEADTELLSRVSAPQAPGAPAPQRAPDGAAAVPQGNFVVLQMNLCNGGGTGCYTGGYAPYEAATVIEFREVADIVTLNEICFNDADRILFPAMARRWAGDWTYYVFIPAMIKDTEDPYRCANGDRFGNAVMGHVPESKWRGVNAWRVRYGAQDGGREARTAACAYAIGDHLACATHLSAKSEPVALTQCRSLMFESRSLYTLRGGRHRSDDRRWRLQPRI
jgi:hypothetical protein